MKISVASCLSNQNACVMPSTAHLRFVFIVTIALLSLTKADAASVNGIFLNERNQVQPFASVEFRSPKNDSFIKKVSADSRGTFIDSLMDGEYLIQIPEHDTFPLQWYSRSGNTRYAQYTTWIGPTMQSDTMKIILKMNPLENPPTGMIAVQVQDSTGQD
ncbi:MAG TPA: hypothetical protein VHO70_18750, partial [Chitinispirillaceae bacterium]|nr:hypothetical protein [Chitinispirillaceae bacterium]